MRTDLKSSQAQHHYRLSYLGLAYRPLTTSIDEPGHAHPAQMPRSHYTALTRLFENGLLHLVVRAARLKGIPWQIGMRAIITANRPFNERWLRSNSVN